MTAKTFLVLFVVIACAFASDYSEVLEKACLEPIATGLCRALEPRYGYDFEKKICTKFIYGGCKGNHNNFLTLEDCMKTCKVST